MPDILDENGLQIKTFNEIRDKLVSDLQAIYGNDINVDPDTPDGQAISIFSQMGVDLREILALINAGFDPDQAYGRILDQRVGINGIKRKGGTFTITPVEIEVNNALSLVGLDGQSEEVEPNVSGLYIVKDDSGNEFYLLESIDIPAPGTYSLLFRAKISGAIEVLSNTINNQVTIIAGVLSVNNPDQAISKGVDEESDYNLKIRRRISVALPSTGYLDSIQSSILNLNDVISAIVWENDTNNILYGVPPGYIWCIVEGGTDEDVANVLYTKKSAGCRMFGSEEFVIHRENGMDFTARFDRPLYLDLYIKFSLSYSETIDREYIKQQIVSGVIWELNESPSGDTITFFVKSINENYKITGMLLSKNGIDWSEIIDITTPQEKFVNSVDRITIS